MILFSLGGAEIVAGVPLTATASDADAAIGRYVDDLRALWRRARDALKATVIQQTFLDVSEPLFGSYDRFVPAFPRESWRGSTTGSPRRRLPRASAARCRTRQRAERDRGWFDMPRWLQGKLEIAPTAAPLYGELVARIVAAQRGLSRKCLVLDLDNTLWGGVIGDDGMDGIVLGEGSALGEAHLALQRYAKRLQERGVILAVCSKNDAANAEAVRPASRDDPAARRHRRLRRQLG